MPRISAIVCTHNRDLYLGQAIDSLLNQDYSDYEIIIVDNASSDRTADVVASRQPNPKLIYTYESTLGLSVARNTGANLAQGELLAYLDDDAIASPQWLSTLVKAFTEDDRLLVAGGRVKLRFPPNTKSPSWLSENLANNLGLYDLGNTKVYVDSPSNAPRGLNYAMYRQFWREIGGFPENLGRVGTNLLSNEELYTTQIALQWGWRVAYIPDALVEHQVSPERLQPAWFWRRGWWQGVSEYHQQQNFQQADIYKFTTAVQKFCLGLGKSLKYYKYPDIRFENLVYAYSQLGYLYSFIRSPFPRLATKPQK